MDDAAFQQELQKRLDLIESAEGATIIVDDLPLTDFVVAVTVLMLVVVLLMVWAY